MHQNDYHSCGIYGFQRNGTHDGYWAAVEDKEQRERFAEWQPDRPLPKPQPFVWIDPRTPEEKRWAELDAAKWHRGGRSTTTAEDQELYELGKKLFPNIASIDAYHQKMLDAGTKKQ